MSKKLIVFSWFVSGFALSAMIFATVLVFEGRKQEREIKEYERKIQEVQQEKKEILEAAFYVKDHLISSYYIDDKERYEAFVLRGVKFILETYEKYKVKKEDRMNKEEMKDFLDVVYLGCVQVGIDPFLLLALGWKESWFNKKAKSPVGAVGVFQIMPYTARLIMNGSAKNGNPVVLQTGDYRYGALLDPTINSKVAILYLRDLFEMFDGRVEWVLFAYNYGHNYVLKNRWRKGEEVFSNLPEKEKEYALSILNVYEELKK